jgi:hypothetical protein
MPDRDSAMTDSGGTAARRPVVLGPGEGRAYPMGRLSAVFKAGGAETEQRYSISEWWLDPHIKGARPAFASVGRRVLRPRRNDECDGRHRMD